MIGQVPSVLVDFGVILGLLSGLVAASKLPPVRWLWRRLVSEPITEWLDGRMKASLEPLTERFDAHEHYVRHHLGPNSTSPAIHERLAALERAHGLSPSEES